MDTTQTITQVLSIIDYQDDKKQFIDQFSSQCVRLAIIEAIEALPEDTKKELLISINPKQGIEEIRMHLYKHITEEAFNQHIQKTSQKQFEDYIETILPTLSSDQRSNLLDFLSKVGTRK